MSTTQSPPPDEPVLTLIQRIKAGQVVAKTLPAEDRRRCVEVLRMEGYALAEIGQILQVNERTIRRDIDQIRSAQSLALDPMLAERMIGELCRQADTSIGHLRRIAREKGASAMERLMAEMSAFKIYREMFEKLQSVGYVPKVDQGIIAEVYQHIGLDASTQCAQLTAELKEIEAVDLGPGHGRRSAQRRELLGQIGETPGVEDDGRADEPGGASDADD